MCGTMSSIKVLTELKINKDREIGSGQVFICICFFKALDIVLNSRKVIVTIPPSVV